MGCRSPLFVTNLQKTSKQKLAGNAAKVTKTQKISVSNNRNFLQKNSASKYDLK
jgi:hypothetical protein